MVEYRGFKMSLAGGIISFYFYRQGWISVFDSYTIRCFEDARHLIDHHLDNVGDER
jgi:hypothetical protein